MAVTCKKCGGAHPVWECTASAAKIAAFKAASAAASIPTAGVPVDESGIATTRRGRGGNRAHASKDAATRVAPSPKGKAADFDSATAGSSPAGASKSPIVDAPKRPRGRPAGPVPFDKKEHDRKKAAARRALAKAEKVKK